MRARSTISDGATYRDVNLGLLAINSSGVLYRLIAKNAKSLSAICARCQENLPVTHLLKNAVAEKALEKC